MEAESPFRPADVKQPDSERDRPRRARIRGSYAEWILAFGIYAAFSLVVFGVPVLGDPAHSYVGIGPGGDPEVYMWFLTWWPHALGHGLNPFLTDQVWAPVGINLAWAHSVPGASLPAVPLTHAFGPVVSYNVLVLLAPPLAGWASYLLCRELGARVRPSLVAGAVFGFSTYELGHLLGHLSHVLVFPLPLCVYVVVRYVKGTLRPRWFVVSLAGLLVLQFLLVTEISLTTALFGFSSLGIGYLLSRGATRTTIARTARLTLYAYGLAAVVLSPYLYHLVAYGVRQTLQSPEDVSSDLLSFVVPSRVTALGGSLAEGVTERFSAGPVETTAYLGLPLVGIALHFSLARRRELVPKVLALSLVLVVVASLGPTLQIAGVHGPPLPWRIPAELPLLKGALPARFSVYAFLVVACIVALWLSEGKTRSLRRWAVALLALVFLFPNVFSPFWKEEPFWVADVSTAPFFTEGMYEHELERGDVVLMFPYGYSGASMLSQAQSDMYFRMAGGYVSTEIPAEFLRWPVLSTLYSGEPIDNYEPQLRAFLCAHAVEAVIVSPSGLEPWEGLVSKALPELRAKKLGGVSLYRVASTCA